MSQDDGLSARGFRGIQGDFLRRAAVYGSDYRDGLHTKVPAAAMFLFFACLAPAVAFGGMMSLATDGDIGVVEMIVATSACGLVYAVAAGQPLTILGGTGPLLVFTGLLFGVCRQMNLPFLPVYAWVGLWTAAFLILLGVVGASRLIAYFTRFTDETFAALISLIFIVQALQGILRAFPAPHVADDSALFGLVLAVGTYMVASSLSRFRHSHYLRRRVREVLADFGPAIAVVLMVFARRLLPSVRVVELGIPETFGTSTGRPWLVSILDVPAWMIAGAAIPALLVTLLVYLDQNITVRIIQSSENALKKGSAYHWDLALVGVLIGVCSLFGLPWLVAATVRSVNHVKALAITEGAGPEAKVVSTVENRLSPLLIHAGIGASLAATGALRQVPMAVLFGLFLYMGIASTRGNQFFERLRLWLTDPALFPPHHYVRRVPANVVHAFTTVQAVCLLLLWAVKSSALGILFPVLIALLVPVRRVLGRWISPEHLAALDAEETTDDALDDLSS